MCIKRNAEARNKSTSWRRWFWGLQQKRIGRWFALKWFTFACVYRLASGRTLVCTVVKPFFPSIRAGLQVRQVQLQQSQPIFQEREDLQQQLQEANLWPQVCLCIPCSKVLCASKPCWNCGRELYVFCIFWRKVRASVTHNQGFSMVFHFPVR